MRVSHSRSVKFHGERFQGKKSLAITWRLVPAEDFSWWPVPAKRFSVVASSRSRHPVNSRGD